MNEPGKPDIEVDAAALRQFSDEVWDELRNVVEPWAARIGAKLAGDSEDESISATRGEASEGGDLGRTLGANGGQYLGTFVGGEQADNVRLGRDFLSKMVKGLEAASLGTAVFAEEMLGADGGNAVDLRLAEDQGSRAWREAIDEGRRNDIMDQEAERS